MRISQQKINARLKCQCNAHATGSTNKTKNATKTIISIHQLSQLIDAYLLLHIGIVRASLLLCLKKLISTSCRSSFRVSVSIRSVCQLSICMMHISSHITEHTCALSIAWWPSHNTPSTSQVQSNSLIKSKSSTISIIIVNVQGAAISIC